LFYLFLNVLLSISKRKFARGERGAEGNGRVREQVGKELEVWRPKLRGGLDFLFV
jgi:hypothetical protein